MGYACYPSIGLGFKVSWGYIIEFRPVWRVQQEREGEREGEREKIQTKEWMALQIVRKWRACGVFMFVLSTKVPSSNSMPRKPRTQLLYRDTKALEEIGII